MKKGSIQRKSRISRLLLLLGIGCGLMIILFQQFKTPIASTTQAPEDPLGVTSSPDAYVSRPGDRVAQRKGEAERTPLPMHRSLIGTKVTGDIKVDSDGKLLLHRDIRRVFDYYLSLRGRLSDHEIRQLLVDYLHQSKADSVSDEVLALFDKYVELLKAEVPLLDQVAAEEKDSVTTISHMLDERQRLRREYLGDATAESFFADQENYEKFQLDRMRIGLNKTMNETEKAAALADAELILTAEQREQRTKTFSYLDVKKAPDSGRAEEIIREKFGEEALDRLAKVEEEKQDWQRKRLEYLETKAHLQKRTELSDAERTAEWDQYLKETLSPSEIRRMEALDSEPDTSPSLANKSSS